MLKTRKLQLVGLDERKDSKFSTFSFRNETTFRIASALLNDPEILILDEPTNGLDPQGIHQIRDIIKILHRRNYYFASHLLDEVEKVYTCFSIKGHRFIFR
jgi:ABC-2 type transport system ATP-binding protein